MQQLASLEDSTQTKVLSGSTFAIPAAFDRYVIRSAATERLSRIEQQSFSHPSGSPGAGQIQFLSPTPFTPVREK